MKALKTVVFMLVLVALCVLMAASADAAGTRPVYKCARHVPIYVGGRVVTVFGKVQYKAAGCPVMRYDGTSIVVGHDARFTGVKFDNGLIDITLLNGKTATGWANQWEKVKR